MHPPVGPGVTEGGGRFMALLERYCGGRVIPIIADSENRLGIIMEENVDISRNSDSTTATRGRRFFGFEYEVFGARIENRREIVWNHPPLRLWRKIKLARNVVRDVGP